MTEILIGLYIILPTLFDYIVANYKKNKTLKIIKLKLNEKGYNVDKRIEKDIVRKLINNCTNWNYYESDWVTESYFCFIPFFRWIFLPSQIKYLCGDYSHFNEIYLILEDIVDNDEDIIMLLKNCGYISIDKEKQQWINDRDNAIKELEKKYDEIEKSENKYDNSNNIIKISNTDDIDTLKEKRKILDEIIELKAKTRNDEIPSEARIIKHMERDKDIESDTYSLKYKPNKNKNRKK